MQQPMYPQQGMYPQPQITYPPQAPTKKRNAALIVVGLVLIGIATLAFLLFAYNAYQYSTVDERFSDLGATWVVDLVKEAALKRMMVFGTVSGVFGIPGVVLAILGMRKR